MSAEQDILAQLNIADLARAVGADEDTTRSAAEQAIPALLGGMHANAQDPGGAQSLLGALGQHQGQTPSVDSVDPAEGQQIVNHVFGGNTDQVVQQLGGLSGNNSSLVAKLLPIIAPIVLNYLSQQILGHGTTTASTPTRGQAGQSGTGQQSGGATTSAGGLGDILGSILGGSGGSGGSSGGLGGSLGQILGGLLGGGTKS